MEFSEHSNRSLISDNICSFHGCTKCLSNEIFHQAILNFFFKFFNSQQTILWLQLKLLQLKGYNWTAPLGELLTFICNVQVHHMTWAGNSHAMQLHLTASVDLGLNLGLMWPKTDITLVYSWQTADDRFTVLVQDFMSLFCFSLQCQLLSWRNRLFAVHWQ